MSARKFAVCLFASLALTCVASTPALASQEIATFAVTSSDSQAGAHPDLGMSFTLDSPGSPEGARNVIVNTPEGIFGNPKAVTQCTSVEFALDRCPSSSQVGLITVYANHNGNPNRLMGTAPIFSRAPTGDQTALFSFVVPIIGVPVSIPVSVRTGGDFGLRFTVSELTQLAPLAGADITFWGFPADPVHDTDRFPRGAPDEPAGCPGVADTSCLGAPVAAALLVRPLINNPSICSGEPLVAEIQVYTYQDPQHPTHKEAAYPDTTGCYGMTFKPVLQGTPTTTAADSAAGLDLTLMASQPLGKAVTPSSIRSAIVTMPEGFTVNPDAADGQGACLESAGQLRVRGTGRMPRPVEDRDLRDRLARPRRPARGSDLHRRAEAGRPVQAFPGRRRLRHARQVRRLPETRSRDRAGSPATSKTCRRSRSKNSNCTSSRRIAG